MVPRKRQRKAGPARTVEEVAMTQNSSSQEVNMDTQKDLPETLIEKSKTDMETLFTLIRMHKSKNDDFDLITHLSFLTETEVGSIWSNWNELTSQESLNYLQERILGDHEGEMKSPFSNFVYLARICLELPQWKEKPVASGLKSSVEIIQGILQVSTESISNFCNEMSQLLEHWFSKGFDDKAAIAAPALVFLLKKCIKGKGTKSDLKRIWALREILFLNQLHDTSSTYMKELLVQAARTPFFVKNIDGVKFVVYLFSLYTDFIANIHDSIKTVLPGASRELACAFGDVYFKAWRTSSGSFRQKIEETCLQNLMYHVVLANRNLPKKDEVFKPVFHILEKFHIAKNDRICQATLNRLWEPILWRHFNAANPMARRNAAQILFSAFPIEDPECRAEEKAAQHERQYQIMYELLKDKNPEVRIAAIEGVCRTVAVFWLMLPLDFINKSMGFILRDLAYDASCAKVRLAVINGLSLILGTCDRAYLFMKKALPRVSDCLHDINESVRAAMVNLLIKVKSIPSIAYWDVCPLEDLLARLAEDKPVVGQRIAKLIMNSFFPLDVDERVKIERCIYLIKKNRNAARKFYEYCEKNIHLHDAVKFMLAVLKHVNKHVKTAQDADTSTASDTSEAESNPIDDADKENGAASGTLRVKKDVRKSRKRKLFSNKVADLSQEDTSSIGSGSLILSQSNSSVSTKTTTSVSSNEEEDSMNDFNVIAGLLDVVALLWVYKSKEIQRPENKDYRVILEGKGSKMLINMFKFYKSSDVVGPILYLCSLLPPSSAATVAGFCLSRLKQIDLPDCTDIPSVENASCYIDSLCNLGRGDDILELITEWISKDLDAMTTKTPRRQSKARGVRFEAVSPPKPKFALQLLRYVLRHPINRAVIMRKNKQQLSELQNSLFKYFPSGKLPKSSDKEVDEKLALSWEYLIKLVVLLHDAENAPKETFAKMEEYVEMAQKTLEDGCDDFISHLIRKLLLVCSNMITIGITDENFIGHTTELCISFLKQDANLRNVEMSLLLAQEIARWAETNLNGPLMKVVITNGLGKMIKVIFEVIRTIKGPVCDEKQLKTLMKDSKSYLSTTIGLLGSSLRKIDDEQYYKVVHGLLRAVIDVIAKEISKANIIENFSGLSEMPFSAYFLMASFGKGRKQLINVMLDEVVNMLMDDELTSFVEHAALLSLLRTCDQDSSFHWPRRENLIEVVKLSKEKVNALKARITLDEGQEKDGSVEELGESIESLIQNFYHTDA